MRIDNPGITRLSQLIIDADKDMGGFKLTNLDELTLLTCLRLPAAGYQIRSNAGVSLGNLAGASYQAAGVSSLSIAGDITPTASGYRSLGSTTARLKDLWLTGLINTFSLARQTTHEVLAATNDDQLIEDSEMSIGVGGTERVGTRKTLAGVVPKVVGFKLSKTALPTGAVWYRIRKVSTDAVLWEKNMFDAAVLDGTPTWYDTTIAEADQVIVDEEIRMCVECVGLSNPNYVEVCVDASDHKAGEYLTHYTGAAWSDHATEELTYHLTTAGKTALCHWS